MKSEELILPYYKDVIEEWHINIILIVEMKK